MISIHSEHITTRTRSLIQKKSAFQWTATATASITNIAHNDKMKNHSLQSSFSNFENSFHNTTQSTVTSTTSENENISIHSYSTTAADAAQGGMHLHSHSIPPAPATGRTSTSNSNSNTLRLKQMYSSLVSDSESSSGMISLSMDEDDHDHDDAMSASSRSTQGQEELDSSPANCRTLYYQSVNSVVPRRGGVPSETTTGCSSSCNEPNDIDVDTPSRPITPSDKSCVDGEGINCRTSYYQSVQNSSSSGRSPSRRQASSKPKRQDQGQNQEGPENQNSKRISNHHESSKCYSSYYQSLPGKGPEIVTPDQASSSKEEMIGGMKSKSRGSSATMKKKSHGHTAHKSTAAAPGAAAECKNPYYRSVQQPHSLTLTSTSEENPVIIFGRPSVVSPRTVPSSSSSHSNSNSYSNVNSRDPHGTGMSLGDDYDQRTLLTASETATVLTGEVSHWHLTDHDHDDQDDDDDDDDDDLHQNAKEPDCDNAHSSETLQSGLVLRPEPTTPSSPTTKISQRRDCTNSHADTDTDAGPKSITCTVEPVDTGLYKLYTPVKVRVNEIEDTITSVSSKSKVAFMLTGSSSMRMQQSDNTPSIQDERDTSTTTARQRIDAYPYELTPAPALQQATNNNMGQQESIYGCGGGGDDHESTAESLASDQVVTSMILRGVDVEESPNIPRKITFHSGQQSRYTSLKDLIVPVSAPASVSVSDRSLLKRRNNDLVRESLSPVNGIGGSTVGGSCTVRLTDQVFERAVSKQLFHGGDRGKDNRLSAERHSNCEKDAIMRTVEDELILTSPTLLKISSSGESEPFHVKHEENGNIVSPVKEVSQSYDDGESVMSSVIHVPNDIKVGTIRDLDLFRKEKCEEDECTFSLFRKGNKPDECNCAIM